mgnify:CR=1 FL=1
MPTSTETLQDIATNASTTRDRAIVRACFVQGEIDRLRGDLQGVADNRTLSDLRRAGPAAVDAATILLASYDAEMTRLCQIPGVLAAILAEMVIEETAP